MNLGKLFHGLEFENDFVLHEDVRTKSFVETSPLEFDGYGHLPIHSQSSTQAWALSHWFARVPSSEFQQPRMDHFLLLLVVVALHFLLGRTFAQPFGVLAGGTDRRVKFEAGRDSLGRGLFPEL